MSAGTLRDRLRAQLADCKMPGALEAVDDILRRIDAGEEQYRSRTSGTPAKPASRSSLWSDAKRLGCAQAHEKIALIDEAAWIPPQLTACPSELRLAGLGLDFDHLRENIHRRPNYSARQPPRRHQSAHPQPH